jgi:hypothetical protein
MARLFNSIDYALNDTTSLAWALAYARFALRDIPNEANVYPADSLEDTVIIGTITALQVVDTNPDPDVTYYRPHLAAAALIEANPTYVTRFSTSGFSEQYRDAATVARFIRNAGKWIDDKIIELTVGRVGGRSLDVRL